MGKGSPSAPPAPDYAGAAQAQANSQYVPTSTPFGNLGYTKDKKSPSGVKAKISLSPDASATLKSQMGMSRGLADMANQQMPGLRDFYSSPMDLSSVPQIADQAYGAFTSRLDPQWQQREQSQQQMLANQGLVPGGEAYDNAMRNFNQARNDAYQQAQLGAIQTMPQTYQLANATYNQPLNTFNAMRSGAQVQNPQFQQYGQAPMLGAAQGQGMYDQGIFNAEVGRQNAMTSGLFGLAGSGLMGAAMISDRRLKSNVVRIGTHPLGIGIYEYDIRGERQRGVMADEVEKVKPEAVVEIGGYKHVRYGLL